jgi:hypothetical protein
VLARFARNMRLADAIYFWAFSSLGASPGCRRSMTPVARPATRTTRRFEHSGIGSLASSTVVSPTATSTTSTPPGGIGWRTIPPWPLDDLGAWDI